MSSLTKHGHFPKIRNVKQKSFLKWSIAFGTGIFIAVAVLSAVVKLPENTSEQNFITISSYEPIKAEIKPLTAAEETQLASALASPEYNYLPEPAKEFVEDAFRVTHELVHTEQNRQDGVPYLNPAYVEYLAKSDEEKAAVAVIPKTYLVQTNSDEPIVTDQPVDSAITYTINSSKVDLRNLNDKKYITDLKDQGDLGICWAFATIEQAESYLMVNDSSYYNNPIKLSTRQLDYILSSNGLHDFTSPFVPYSYTSNSEYTLRTLGDGSNFTSASYAMMHGVSLVSESTLPWSRIGWDESDLTSVPSTSAGTAVGATLPMRAVINYNQPLYEVLGTREVDSTDTPMSSADIQAIKYAVLYYGGAYAGTVSPTSTCSAINTASGDYYNTYIIRVDDHCLNESSHAMQIIGWDDDYNYRYDYCRASAPEYNGATIHRYYSTACSSSAQGTVTGRGAWLIRNSWGNNSAAYVWLAYDSLQSNIAFITSMTKMQDRNWDVSYGGTVDNYIISRYISEVAKIGTQAEKLQAVKFVADSTAANYSVDVLVGRDINSASRVYSTNVTVLRPGVVTVDLSDQNLQVSNNRVFVRVGDTNQSCGDACNYFYMNSISLFTKNVSTTPILSIENENVYIPDDMLNNSSTPYRLVVYANTRNLTAGANVSVKLYNQSRADLTLGYIGGIEDNIVAANNVNTIITIKGNLPKGLYTLELSSGTAKDTLMFSLGKAKINYQAGANGRVNKTVESIDPFNGKPTGAIASANSGYRFKNWTDANGKVVSTSENFIPTKNLQGYFTPTTYIANFEKAESVLSLNITDQNYNYDTSAGTISGITDEVTISTYLSKLGISSGFTAKIYNGDKQKSNTEFIGTGNATKIYNESGSVVRTITTIVTGDVSGDGKINSSDYVKVRKHIMGTALTGVYFTAADYNKDGRVASSDYVKIKKIIMER